jgi:hypothetical protein
VGTESQAEETGTDGQQGGFEESVHAMFIGKEDESMVTKESQKHCGCVKSFKNLPDYSS